MKCIYICSSFIQDHSFLSLPFFPHLTVILTIVDPTLQYVVPKLLLQSRRSLHHASHRLLIPPSRHSNSTTFLLRAGLDRRSGVCPSFPSKSIPTSVAEHHLIFADGSVWGIFVSHFRLDGRTQEIQRCPWEDWR